MMSPLHCLTLALCILGCACAPANAAKPSSRQSCEGKIATDADGMLVLEDVKKGASPWCDAYIGDGKDSAIARQVLARCPMGSRCVIDGLFAGHGVFYWTKIISVAPR